MVDRQTIVVDRPAIAELARDGSARPGRPIRDQKRTHGGAEKKLTAARRHARLLTSEDIMTSNRDTEQRCRRKASRNEMAAAA